MDKQTELEAAARRHMDITHEMGALKREQQQITRDAVRQLVEIEAFECFTVNWRAVNRMMRR